jgi:hypothetical protein
MSTPRDDGDYQHDQAHDLVHGQVPSPPVHDQHESPPLPPALQDGDYAYDQAHDFGRGA